LKAQPLRTPKNVTVLGDAAFREALSYNEAIRMIPSPMALVSLKKEEDTGDGTYRENVT
jgi:hypothetical protein